ncbi:HNH endonuclease signature motif containing protein, partial [Jiangella asiatica]
MTNPAGSTATAPSPPPPHAASPPTPLCADCSPTPPPEKSSRIRHTTYAPPAALAAFVIARDITCRFPTCTRPSCEADIDHKIPYHDGGTTGAANTWALHRTHHLDRTHHGHTIHTGPDGHTSWTTPAGFTYPIDPEAVGPMHTT